MNRIYPTINKAPEIFAVPWTYFIAVVAMTILSMTPLVECIGFLGLVLSLFVGAILYLFLYGFHLVDKVSLYGRLHQYIKNSITPVSKPGQIILWE